MAKLPRIVWHRLRRIGAPGKPSGRAEQSEHPDPNLLSAFLEQSLTERERKQVTGHLAECGECREQLALALSEPRLEGTTQQAARATARGQAWRLWPALRWAALAASVVVVCVVIVLHRPELSPPNNPTSVAQPSPTDKTASEERARDARVVEGLSRPSAAQREIGTASTKLRPAPADRLKEEKAVRRGTADVIRSPLKASATPAPSPVLAPPTSLVPGSRSETPSSNRSVAGSSPGETTAAAPPSAKKEPAGSAFPAPPPPVAIRPSRELEPARPARPESSAGRKQAVLGATMSRLDSSKSPGAAAAPVEPSSTTGNLQELRRAGQPFSAGGTVALRYAESSPRWSISSFGKLQRSVDSGKTWEDVTVDSSVDFRAVSAVGANVWAGGLGGALYHSLDNGAHWTRVSLPPASGGAPSDVTAIRFEDPEHGVITTAAGETWITQDGGKNWTRKP